MENPQKISIHTDLPLPIRDAVDTFKFRDGKRVRGRSEVMTQMIQDWLAGPQNGLTQREPSASARAFIDPGTYAELAAIRMKYGLSMAALFRCILTDRVGYLMAGPTEEIELPVSNTAAQTLDDPDVLGLR